MNTPRYLLSVITISVSLSSFGQISSTGTIDRREYVDLGLSVLWSTCNIGASNPYEMGCYFAWGDLCPQMERLDYDWSNYKWCKGSEDTVTKYNSHSSRGIVDHKTTLDNTDDAAFMLWGEGWRMPTAKEFTELQEKCEWTWTKENGRNGYRISSRVNGNSIFLPADEIGFNRRRLSPKEYSGGYWTSSLSKDSYTSTFALYFNAQKDFDNTGLWTGNRACPQSIRPVAKRP